MTTTDKFMLIILIVMTALVLIGVIVSPNPLVLALGLPPYVVAWYYFIKYKNQS